MYWFCHISKWICHRYTCVLHPEPSSLLPPHKLYITVLVLPNIKMNPPQVYMCSPSWTLLLLPPHTASTTATYKQDHIHTWTHSLSQPLFQGVICCHWHQPDCGLLSRTVSHTVTSSSLSPSAKATMTLTGQFCTYTQSCVLMFQLLIRAIIFSYTQMFGDL